VSAFLQFEHCVAVGEFLVPHLGQNLLFPCMVGEMRDVFGLSIK